MYRSLLAFLVFSSVALCVTTLFLLGTDSQVQLTPPKVTKPPTHAHLLGGAQDYTQQKMDITVSYPVRIATQSLGLVAGLISLYFLYGKKHKGTKVMYFPLLVALSSFAMFLYNVVQLSTNVDIFGRLEINANTVKEGSQDSIRMQSMFVDLGSSALGLLAQAGTFFYLLNRRV